MPSPVSASNAYFSVCSTSRVAKSPQPRQALRMISPWWLPCAVPFLSLFFVLTGTGADILITDQAERIQVDTPALSASINKKGYVTGVAGGIFVDKKTGFHDAGFGLEIVDWLMEPGSDEAYRDQLKGDLRYDFNNAFHGKIPKRSIEGPQICTQAKELHPTIIRGQDFVAVRNEYVYQIAAPGKKSGSKWTQMMVFPGRKRYFIGSDNIQTVNTSENMFLRLDMPGHIRHNQGDSFSEVYLSYLGRIPAGDFLKNFAPDEKLRYERKSGAIPERFIRAYHLRDSKTGQAGPWLCGMTLNPSVVSEAWCHQRGYVCLTEEFGGRPIKAGGAFSAAFIVGYFDSIEEMNAVYDLYAGYDKLEADASGWRLLRN